MSEAKNVTYQRDFVLKPAFDDLMRKIAPTAHLDNSRMRKHLEHFRLIVQQAIMDTSSEQKRITPAAPPITPVVQGDPMPVVEADPLPVVDDDVGEPALTPDDDDTQPDSEEER